MKITTYKLDIERAVLTGMIVSSQVMARIHAHLKGERRPFANKYSNVIAGWCLDYFAKYHKAPRKGILIEFQDWALKRDGSSEEVTNIEQYLSDLSNNHQRSKGLNVNQLVDTAERLFNKVRADRLAESVAEDCRRGDSVGALEKIAAFRPVKLTMRKGLAIFTEDRSAFANTINAEESEVMIHYPQGLGDFFGPHLQRDGFISFMAPEKRGKSWWLMDMVWRAVKERRRTMFYSVGDMSEKQMLWRWACRISRRSRLGGELVIPTQIEKLKRYESRVVSKRTQCKPVSFSAVSKNLDELSLKLASKQTFVRTYCTSNGSTSVADIRADIESQIQAGWVPDVVVIDYADILAPEQGAGKQELRHQINITWMALRRLSQDYHCLVVTATQSDSDSNDAIVLRRKNFSEDKRKYSHVTGIVGINQTEEEKKKGICRLNWIALREGTYYESRCVHVAGCLAIANPAIVSAW